MSLENGMIQEKLERGRRRERPGEEAKGRLGLLQGSGGRGQKVDVTSLTAKGAGAPHPPGTEPELP